MRYLSLFSGIESASCAWHSLGWTPAAFAEIDPFASAVLVHRFPHVPNLGDVTKADFNAIGPIDLLVGGSPCQSFSVAGRRLGLDDPRGNLALVYGGVLYAKRPRWFVFENVPGLLSSDGGWDFGTLLAAFSGRPSGSVFEPPADGWRTAGVVEPADGNSYGLAWRVLDAQYIRVDTHPRAVPQRRRRVFVVGYLGGWAPAAAVLLERQGLRGDPAPRREARKDVAAGITTRAGNGSRGAGANGNLVAGTLGQRSADHPSGVKSEADFLVAFGGANPEPINTATTLNAKGGAGRMDFESETLVAHSLRGGGFDASEDGTGRGTPLVPIAFSACDQGFDAQHGFTPTLRVGAGREKMCGGQQMAVASPAEQAWTVRRLCPLECERLQGFPDGWTAIPYRGKPAADGPRYKAIGNSKAVNCVRWIGQRIALVQGILDNVRAEAAE